MAEKTKEKRVHGYLSDVTGFSGVGKEPGDYTAEWDKGQPQPMAGGVSQRRGRLKVTVTGVVQDFSADWHSGADVLKLYKV